MTKAATPPARVDSKDLWRRPVDHDYVLTPADKLIEILTQSSARLLVAT
jgi:hypothetical protein